MFDIGGNKYRVIAGIAFSVQMLWVKAVLTHAQYDEGDWCDTCRNYRTLACAAFRAGCRCADQG